MAEKKNVGEVLLKLRTQRGWSRRELAEKTGLSPQGIQAIEEGKKKDPRGSTLSALSSAFGVSIEELMGRLPLQPIITETGPTVEPTGPEINHRLVYRFIIPHLGLGAQPLDVVYIENMGDPDNPNLQGFMIKGDILEPMVREGDVILVEKDANMETGDLIACVSGEVFHIGRLLEVNGKPCLVNIRRIVPLDDCSMVAPIVQIRKKMK